MKLELHFYLFSFKLDSYRKLDLPPTSNFALQSNRKKEAKVRTQSSKQAVFLYGLLILGLHVNVMYLVKHITSQNNRNYVTAKALLWN